METILQISDKRQIRIRMNTYKDETKVFVQEFFQPGPNSKWTTGAGPDGYCHGKAVTMTPDKWQEFVKLVNAFRPDKTNPKTAPSPAPAPTKNASPQSTEASTKRRPRPATADNNDLPI